MLIVTIIVIIILAAAVILTVGKNNPVESAREAAFKEDLRSFQDDLALSVSKDYTKKAGQRDTKFNADKYTTGGEADSVYTYIPSFNKKYEGKFVIKEDELIYVEDKVNDKEKTWCNDLGIGAQVKTAAQKVSENVAEYYGKRITNYSANGVTDWKIFHSDGKNVYIIASDYVPVDKLPETSAKHKPTNADSSYPKAAPFNNVTNDYTGSANITDEKIKALNSDYFSKGYTSTNFNMKAVAYMLDTKIWSSFATDKAEYAIGGPTVEMLFKSYNQKYKVDGIDYRAQASSTIGYKISKDGGANWANNYIMLKTDDDLYVLPASSGADAMWLGSPSADYKFRVMAVYYDGYVYFNGFYESAFGFRPIVSLKSDITLKAVEGGFEIQ